MIDRIARSIDREGDGEGPSLPPGGSLSRIRDDFQESGIFVAASELSSVTFHASLSLSEWDTCFSSIRKRHVSERRVDDILRAGIDDEDEASE